MAEKDSKDLAVENLKKAGYDAFLEKGVVCTRYSADSSDRKQYVLKFISTARMMGYEGSIGVLPREAIKETVATS